MVIILQDCAGVILYTAEAATQMALDAIQILGIYFVVICYFNITSQYYKATKSKAPVAEWLELLTYNHLPPHCARIKSCHGLWNLSCES